MSQQKRNELAQLALGLVGLVVIILAYAVVGTIEYRGL